jgi:dipeptidyl aminopeptidase/acylaminoacyl peptidase
MEDIIVEDISIPVDDGKIFLKGSIYYKNNTPKKAPWIINLAGFMDHRESKFVKIFSEKFANAGYYVMSYDYRAHGETAKQTGKNALKWIDKIFLDISKVISWILNVQKDRILENKIALFGRSFGGAIILTQGFIDRRAKFLIALCTRYDYATVSRKGINFSEERIKKMSPKYFLRPDSSNSNRILIIHSKDDEIIPFENLYQIKEQLGLSNENIIIYETGGHSFKGNRDNLFNEAIKFLNK